MKKKTKHDWFTKEGKLVVRKGKALRDIKKGTKLVTYGIVFTQEDLE